MHPWELRQYIRKVADATAVPMPDQAQSTASAAPLPELAVGNKPAPGQTGPKGIAPRTNYSRVNFGSPPPTDVGGLSAQKGVQPDFQNFLPQKVAHKEVSMPASTHWTIQDMIKAAAAGARDNVDITVEAMRQFSNSGESTPVVKTAAPSLPESIPTNYVEKLAAAVDFIVKNAEEPGPGTGPNALGVLEATSSNNEIEAGHGGEATPAHQPPKTPGEHKPAETPHGPANALDDNASMMHGKSPDKLAAADIFELRKVATLGATARRGKELLLGTKAKGIAHDLKDHAGALPAAIRNKMQQAHMVEKAKVHGTRAAVATPLAIGAGLGARHLVGKHEKKKTEEESKHKEASFSLGGLRSGAKAVSGKIGDEAKWQAGTARGLAKDVRKGAGKALESYGESVHGNLNAHGVTAAQGALGGAASMAAFQHGKKLRSERKKEASAPDSRLVDYVLAMTKAAEDAINPAQISAGAAVPPETSAAGESGGAPAGGPPKGPTGLVGSNEAAIRYDRSQVKAPIRAELARVLAEPALTSAHDHVLDQAFDHTGQAGTKLSHSIRSLAARAILEKMAEEACGTTGTKKKVSAGMGPFQAPPPGGAAQGPM